MNIRDYDPAEGYAAQGDIIIVPVPAGITIATGDEIAAKDGRLIIQEGEVTGHHHAISLGEGRKRNFRPVDAAVADPFAAARSPSLRRRLKAEPAARLYRDPAAAESMRQAGILERTDLAIGFLVVGEGGAVLRHQEHDAIRIPAGSFYLGRQVESAGADERLIAD